MFHSDTQHLIDLWNGLAAAPGVRAGVPDRSALRPEAMGARLNRAFQMDRSADARLILAGGWIESLHDRSLAGESWRQVFTEDSWPVVAAAIGQTVREGRPVVIAAVIGEHEPPIEITLTPWRGSGGEVDRILGLYTPTRTLTLAASDSRLLSARLSIGVGEPARAPLSLAALDGRRIA